MKTRSGFSDHAADKIWNDHLGNNAYVTHRNQCATCGAAYGALGINGCHEGMKILEAVIDEVMTKIDEVHAHQN